MLSNSNMFKLWTYVSDLQDCEEKTLLFDLITEYKKYTDCGTPEECMQRKEWMSMSIDDIRVNFNSFVKEMQNEVKCIREEVKTTKKKSGRKKKED